jgi:MFS family permease
MRYGQYRYYWLALFASVTGHQMLLSFTLQWTMYDLTEEVLDITRLTMAIALPAIFFNLIGGALADRLEPKYMVAGAQAVSATAVALLATVVLTGWVEPWHLFVTAGVIGAVQAFDQPSRSSVFPRLVEREHIVNAVAMESFIWNAVRIIGPLIAGIVVERVSIQASMFTTAATFYVLGAVVACLRLRPRPPARGQVLRQVAAGVGYIRSHSVFSFIMLLTFCNSMFGMAYIHLMPVFAKEVLDVGAEKISWLFAAVGVGAILGTVIIGNLKDKHPIGLVILGGAMLYGVGLILFAWAASQQEYWACMAILVGTGAAHSLYITGGLAVLQNLVPDQLRGRVMGLYGITWSLGPLSMAYGGPVADWLDAPWAVATGAVVILVVASMVLVSSPQIRSLQVRVPEAQRAAYQLVPAAGDG